MKKLLFVLAFLLCFGIVNSYATNIPQMVDPKNYPTVWTEVVYNGSGSDIATGRVVLWDFDTSVSDAGSIYNDTGMWVKTANVADSVWTAGVTTIGKGISNGDVGRIIIKGPAVVHNNNVAPTVNTIVATTSAGYVGVNTPSTDTALLGVVIKASAAGNDIEGEIGAGSSLIYVDPTLNPTS